MIARPASILGMIVMGLSILSTQSFAQEGASGPVCRSKTLKVTETAEAAPSITINPISLAPACYDSDADFMTVTAASIPVTLEVDAQGRSKNRVSFDNTLGVGASMSFTYTVTDNLGRSTTSIITVVRENPED